MYSGPLLYSSKAGEICMPATPAPAPADSLHRRSPQCQAKCAGLKTLGSVLGSRASGI